MKFSIVYFGDIHAVNGVNFVTNFFVKGKDLFSDNGVEMNYVFSKNGITDLSNINDIQIGKHIDSYRHKFTRTLRQNLAQLLHSKHRIFAQFKIVKNLIEPARWVVQNYINKINEEDCILFQDILTAYFYLTDRNRNYKVKTVLLLHCDVDVYEQIFLSYPSIIGSKFENKLQEIKRVVYKEISTVVFLSEKALYHNQLLLEGKSTFIYNGIDEISVKYLNDDFFNIVCVGSISGRKGQELIIKALSQIDNRSNIRLHIIGSGPKLEDLKELTESVGLTDNVVFYGVRNDIPKLLESMDLMVLPSKSEGMPISILEGMRQGMYILATKVGAIPEMLTSDFGDFIERNPDDIKEKIEMVFRSSDEEIKEFKKSARKYFLEHFTHEKMIENYSSLFKRLLHDEKNI